jgi:hypothetical protein
VVDTEVEAAVVEEMLERAAEAWVAPDIDSMCKNLVETAAPLAEVRAAGASRLTT